MNERFWSKVDKSKGCWTWTGFKNHAGYGELWTGVRPDRKRIKAHRLSWEISNGPIPNGKSVLHSCDNPPCVNPSHLRLGTYKDNSVDAAQRLRLRTSKLTLDQVREISRLKGKDETSRSIARRYGVCQGTISHIWTKRNWSHLEGVAA